MASAASFAELPLECVALILAQCAPGDIGRLASVSRTWAAAASSEQAWGRWWRLKRGLEPHFPALSQCHSGLDVFHTLRRGAHAGRAKKNDAATSLSTKHDATSSLSSKNDATSSLSSKSDATSSISSSSSKCDAPCSEYLLTADPSSGFLSVHASAFRCLYFFLRNDAGHTLDELWITPYGLWPSSAPGALFPNAAPLASGLFHIHGELDPEFPLPPGKYSLSFRIATPPPLPRRAWAAAAPAPAQCFVTLAGEAGPDIDSRVDLHKGGRDSRRFGQEPEPSCSGGGGGEPDFEVREPEFWAKSADPEFKPMPWHALNRQILQAASYWGGATWQGCDAEDEWQCGRVKPWRVDKRKQEQELQWQEFFVGEVELKDEGGEGEGSASLSLDVVLTDLDTHAFKGAIWMDSLVLFQVLIQ